jgi:hypothetical protein
MLSVFLGCLRPVCVHNVASVSGLSSSCLCTQCCQCFWVVFVLCVYTMLPVFLGCRNIVCTNRTKTTQKHWQHCVHKQDEDNPETLTTLCTQTGRRQSRNTGNIVYTNRTKTTQKHWQHCVHKQGVHNVASVSGLSSSCVCTQCCQCFWVVFVLFVYTMLSVFLGCLRPVCVHNDEDKPETLATLCTQTGQRQPRNTGNIVYTHRTKTTQKHVLCVYTMLPVFLGCLRPVCVHNVASVSGLSSSCLCTQCCQCFWVVFVLFVYTMLFTSTDKIMELKLSVLNQTPCMLEYLLLYNSNLKKDKKKLNI